MVRGGKVVWGVLVFVSDDGGRGEREVGGVEAMYGVREVGGKWVKGGNGIYIR